MTTYLTVHADSPESVEQHLLHYARIVGRGEVGGLPTVLVEIKAPGERTLAARVRFTRNALDRAGHIVDTHSTREAALDYLRGLTAAAA